jgi:hypothetical protein
MALPDFFVDHRLVGFSGLEAVTLSYLTTLQMEYALTRDPAR